MTAVIFDNFIDFDRSLKEPTGCRRDNCAYTHAYIHTRTHTHIHTHTHTQLDDDHRRRRPEVIRR